MISVLYVDDEQDLREVAQLFLEESGEFKVGISTSAQEALTFLNTQPYDVIISDYLMPRMNGISFLKAVRERFGDIPFILFTGRGREEVVIEAINNGADFYLQKGGDPEAQFAELSHKIRQAVARRSAEHRRTESEKRLLDIINFLPDATFAIDKAGHVISWNRAMEEMTGVAAKDILGRGNYEYAIPFYGTRRPILIDLVFAPHDEIRQRYSFVHIDRNILTGETIDATPNGIACILWGMAAPLYNNQGVVVGAIESIRDITSRKRAEEDLAFKNIILSTQQETTLDAILIVDDEGKILNYNRNFVRLWGIPAELIASRQDDPVLQYVTGQLTDPDAFLSRVRYLYEHKEEKSFEEILIKDGRVLERFSAPMLGEGGRYYGRVWYFRDITGRRKAEAALKEGERQLSMALDVSHAGIWEWNLATETVAFDDRFHALLGYAPGELPTSLQKWLTYHHPDDVPVWRGKAEAYLKGERTLYESEHRIRTKTGDWAWIFTRGQLVPPSTTGSPSLFIGIAMNVTGRKEAEDALLKSETRFQSLYTHMIEGAALHNLIYDGMGIPVDYVIVETNPAFEKQLGIPRERVVGKTSREAYNVAEPPYLERYARVALTGVPDTFETYFQPLDRYFSISAYCPGKGMFATIFEDITERKKAEATLRESEEKFRELAELLPLMVFELDLDFQVTYANHRAQSDLGFTEADIELGINALSFIASSQHAVVREVVQKQLAGIPFEPQEYTALHKDGSTFPVIIYSAPILRNGNPAGFRGVIIDITARKKLEEELHQKNETLHAAFEQLTATEEELRQNYEELQKSERTLRESEEKFRRIAENAPDMIYRMSLPYGKYEYVSPAAASLTGYTPEEFYADPSIIWKVIHPAWKEYVRENLNSLMRGELQSVYEFQIVDRAGNIHWINQRNMFVTDDREIPVAIEGIVTDITRQKEVERELRHNELRSLAVSENAGSWIWEIDTEGIYRYSSPAIAHVLGYRTDELVGQLHFYDLFDPAVREDLKAIALAAIGRREPFRDFVNINLHKNGTPVILSSSGTPVFDENGTFTGYCGIDEDITRRKLAEDSLSKSQEMLAEAMDLANLVNWEHNLLTDVFTFNDRFYALYATTAEREGGYQMPAVTYAREFVHPDDRHLVAEEAEKVLASTDPNYVSQREHRIIRRDGQVRHIVVRIRVVKDAAGRTIGTHGANQDITERKLVEEALRASEARYRLLSDNVHDVIWTADMDMHLTYISPSVQGLRGMTPEEALAEPLSAALTPASFAELTQSRHKNLEFIRQYPEKVPSCEILELEFYRKDRSTVWTETVIAPAFDNQKRPLGVVGVMRDITIKKQADRALRESEEKYRALVETSPNIVWEVDLQGNFRFISSRVMAIMGYRPEELTGKNILGLVEAQGQPAARELLVRYTTTSGPLPPFEVPARHSDGSALVLEIHPSRILSDDGTLTGFRGVAQDITERKRAEEAVRQANRQLTLLSSITRHDLLNKITVILGNLKIAETRCTDPELIKYLNKMRTATTAIKSQIEFTRIYQKLGTNEPQWIHLDTLMPRTQVPDTVILDVDVNGVQLRADPMLERVFFNLLDNSLRHGKHVTKIRVSSYPAGKDLVVIWEDNGVGIAAEEKGKIFDRGYGENTGLGMFLVREILALTGITIAETGEPGAGARFEIVVPEGAYRLTGDPPLNGGS